MDQSRLIVEGYRDIIRRQSLYTYGYRPDCAFILNLPLSDRNEMKIDCRGSTQKMCSNGHLTKNLLTCKDG
jgi:hypothetical protein